MKRALAWQTVLAASTAMVITVAVGWLSLSSLKALVAGGDWVSHAHEVASAIDHVQASLAGVEAGRRVYSVTRAPAELADYRARRRVLDEAAARLDRLAGDETERQRLLRIHTALAEYVAALDAPSSAGAEGPATALAGVLDEVAAREAALLAARREADRSNGTWAYTVLAIGVGIGAIFMVSAGILIALGITRAHAAAAAQRASEARLRAMFNTMVSGLVITDGRGRITAMNPAFARMLGFPEGALMGRAVADFIVLPDGPGAPTIEEERDWILGRSSTGAFRRSDGDIVPIEVALTSFEADGHLLYAANWTDITERLAVDRMKDEFVSVVSHELRTPLTSIRGALQLVLADPPQFQDEDHASLLTIAQDNCERLIRIINDILDVAKIEAGQIELQIRSCDAGELARAAVQNVAEIARRAGVEVVTAADAPAVRGDFDRLTQVLVNLLSNAVKFAPGGTRVTLAAVPDGADVIWSVTDQGQGIPEADLGRLFRKFQQLDGSATRKQGGTGLGLSIVKALVEQHGGSVWVTSRVGIGTTFFVRLPAATAADIGFAPPAPEPHAAARRRRSILIVDDDADLRRILRRQLESAGYDVSEAADGEAAVAAALAHAPDLITMDLVMPGAGGLAAIHRLADDPRTAAIPVVVISAIADDVSIAHPYAVVPKPVDADRLRREIGDLIGRPTTATLILAEDDDHLRTVLTKALARDGFRVLAAANGQEARRIFDTTPCDALVVDLVMPVLDGFDLIDYVRHSEAGGATPIIVISGADGADGASLRLGANLFLQKPVHPDVLLRELKRLVA